MGLFSDTAALVTVGIVTVTVCVQAMLVVVAYRLLFTGGRRFAWWMVAFTVTVMAIRRMGLLYQWYDTGQPPGMMAELLALTTSSLALAALVTFDPLFGTFFHSTETLALTESRLRTVVHEMPVMMAAFDRDGRIIAWNRECETVTGYGAREIVGNAAALEWLAVDEPGLVRLRAAWSRETEELHNCKLVIKARDGAPRHLSWSNISRRVQIPGWATWGIGVDITRETQVEQARQRLECERKEVTNRLQMMLDRMPVGCILNDAQWRFTYWNPAAEQIFGYSMAEVVGKEPFGLITPESARVPVCQIFERLKTDGRPLDANGENVTRDGKTIYCEWKNSAIRSHDGTFLGVISMCQDVSEARNAELEREQLIANLEAKNRELEQFTYTVSHDLKSPLVTIKGFLGLLNPSVVSGDVEQFRADIARIDGAADRMKLMLDQLLELSRIGRVVSPPELVSTGNVARQAEELLQGVLQARRIAVRIEPNLPVVCADRIRLLEVFTNLIENASKFMGDVATPTIRIGCRDVSSPGGLRTIFVEDNGIGIEPRFHEKVFGLFDKLDPRSSGTGIGLALCKRIIEVQGGRIWVESAGLGTGTTFCFQLPPAPVESAANGQG